LFDNVYQHNFTSLCAIQLQRLYSAKKHLQGRTDSSPSPQLVERPKDGIVYKQSLWLYCACVVITCSIPKSKQTRRDVDDVVGSGCVWRERKRVYFAGRQFCAGIICISSVFLCTWFTCL